MALVECVECKKTYSDTLKACPHCGYKRYSNAVCPTCKIGGRLYVEEAELTGVVCFYCGFPILEDHSVLKVSSDEITEQNMLIEKEKAEVERIAQKYREQLEQYRDKTINRWRSELDESINSLEAEINGKNAELAKLGLFSFGKKSELKKEILQLQGQILVNKEKSDQVEEVEKRMTRKIVSETTGESIHGDNTKARLNRYIVGFTRRVQRNNSDYNARRELAKDRMMQILAENGKPMAKLDVVDIVKKKYPEYDSIRPEKGMLEELLIELHKEARLEEVHGLVKRIDLWERLVEKSESYYYCNSGSFGRPIPPDPESLFITDVEKELVVKQVQKDKGDSYSSYMEGIAEKFGYGPIRKCKIQWMNKSIQEEALSSMAAIVNAGAAVANSKKSSPALVGGAVNALAGPVMGVAAVYATALQNREKDAKRIHAELQRDIYLSKNAQDRSMASFSVRSLNELDYKLLQMEFGADGSNL